MGFAGFGSQEGSGSGSGSGSGTSYYGGSSGSWRFLTRRKKVNSHVEDGDDNNGNSHGAQLAKELTIPHLMAIGVGATIGAGVYVLVGTVAREHDGPALPLSFMVAGFAAALSALFYADLASCFPSVGSAYHYAYICLGEGYIYSPLVDTFDNVLDFSPSNCKVYDLNSADWDSLNVVIIVVLLLKTKRNHL